MDENIVDSKEAEREAERLAEHERRGLPVVTQEMIDCPHENTIDETEERGRADSPYQYLKCQDCGMLLVPMKEESQQMDKDRLRILFLDLEEKFTEIAATFREISRIMGHQNMTKFRLEFDLSIFIEGCRPTMAKYFRGEITAEVAAKHLGIGRNKWEMHMAEIFSEALRGGAFSTITEIEQMPSFSKTLSVHVSPDEFVSKIFSIGDIYLTEDGALKKLLKYYEKENNIFTSTMERWEERGDYKERPDLKEYHKACVEASAKAVLGIKLAIDHLEEEAYPAMTEYHRARGFKAPLEWESKKEGEQMPAVTVGHIGSNADFICDGREDNIEISAALELASLQGNDVVVTGNYSPKIIDEMKAYAEKKKINITFRPE